MEKGINFDLKPNGEDGKGKGKKGYVGFFGDGFGLGETMVGFFDKSR